MNIFSQITNMISSNLNIMFLESVFDYIIASIFRISCYILNLVKLILNLIFDLAGTDFFSAEAIGDIGKRLYVLLGIFMLIKITISCVTYLINPDKSDDKENGFGSIIKRTVISLLLLLAVPSVFNFAKQAQIAIVDTLPKIILGNAGNVDIDDVGERIAYSTMLAFVDYTEGCNDGSIAGRPDANGQIVDYQNGAGNIKVYSMDSLINNASEVISATCGSKKRYEVLWYLAPLVAGYLVFMLVSMAFYVGIRTIKFGFLQLIAPIPIASYVDPKSSKKSFDSWVHNCVSVYIDLFIRLGVIYLMIYLFEIVLGSITSSVVVYGETIGGPRVAFIKLFIILSIILFAKEAPKFISDVLGIKAEGSISEMFKRGGGLAGASLALGRDGIAGYANKMNRIRKGYEAGGTSKDKVKFKTKDRMSALGSAFRSVGSSARGGFGGAVFKKQGYKDAMVSAQKTTAKAYDLANNLHDQGISRKEYYNEIIKKRFGITPTNDVLEFEIKSAKDASDKSKEALDYVHKYINQKFSEAVFDQKTVDKLEEKFHTKGIQIGDQKINFRDCQYGGTSTIATMLTTLDQISKNASNKYSAAEVSQAEAWLDKMQGEVDKYVIDNVDSGLVNGFDKYHNPNPANPAFKNLIQDASDNIGKSSKTSAFGRKMQQEAMAKGIMDSSGRVIKGQLGAWLALNKKEGQTFQETAKASMDVKEIVVKDIANKFDKK